MKIPKMTCQMLTVALLSLGLFWGQGQVSAATGEETSARVAAHVAAGEFQSALQIAQEQADPEVREQLLAQISQAQLQQGELAASRATSKRLPANKTRVELAGRRASQQAMNGTGADFESLIELIMAQTSPPALWMDVDGTGGTINEYETGVRVDANGLLARMTRTEENRRLQELGLKARKADLNADLAQAAGLRMVSLTRLEQAVAERLAQGLPVVESMKNLAGLYQIQHVFVFPETGEIVLAGPASGWEYTAQGQPVSSQNGHPTLQLDDFVTVLRTFSRDGQGIFGCSINPRQEGLRDLKAYVASSQEKGPLSAKAVGSWATMLQRKLGLQDIEIYGVSPGSRVARVIVEADFRMKLIGIGKLDGGPEVPNYFQLMTATQAADVSSLDALRWWLDRKSVV